MTYTILNDVGFTSPTKFSRLRTENVTISSGASGKLILSGETSAIFNIESGKGRIPAGAILPGDYRVSLVTDSITVDLGKMSAQADTVRPVNTVTEKVLAYLAADNAALRAENRAMRDDLDATQKKVFHKNIF